MFTANGNATHFGPPQSANNYTYDAIGNLLSDSQAHVDTVAWTVYGKIHTIADSAGEVKYFYNTAQERVQKIVNASLDTWYVRDAQGNTLALYDNKVGQTNRREQHLYGSSRLGMWNPNVNLATNNAATVWDTIGKKSYELNNHLGNVMATITDARTSHTGYYTPNIVASQDYYAYGALMPGRASSSSTYRYGFNGKENDNEIKGIGNQQDYGERIYDPRVGRFLSVDPITANYPELTPYQFASNKPIQAIDIDGLEAIDPGSVTSSIVTYQQLTRAKSPQERQKVADAQMRYYEGVIKVNSTLIAILSGNGLANRLFMGSVFFSAFNDNRSKTPQGIARQNKQAQEAIANSIILWSSELAIGKVADIFESLISRVPYGMTSEGHLLQIVNDIKQNVGEDAGITSIGIRGSRVTGKSFSTGQPVTNSSDYDFFIVSDKLYEEGVKKGIKAYNGALPVGQSRKFPSVVAAQKQLAKDLGVSQSDVSIRIYSRKGYEKIIKGQGDQTHITIQQK